MKATDKMDRLIDQWLDSTIDEPGMGQLNAWIKESPENTDHFSQRTHMHSRLFDWAKSKDPKVVEFQPKSRWLRATLGMAAAVAGFLLLGNWILQPSPGDPVGTLTANVGGELWYQGKRLEQADTTIRTGTFELKGGVSSFAFGNGVEVVVESPAAFEIESSLRMTLSHGKLSASVPPEGVGFTVDTPAAEVVDFGTEFAVEVAEDLSSEVHVFDGEVDVKPLVNRAAESVRLVSNNATRIEHQSNVPIGIEVDHDRFLRSLQEPKKQYSREVRNLKPLVYYRMGPKTFEGRKGLEFISKGKMEAIIATGKIGASLRLEGTAKEGYALAQPSPSSNSGHLSGICWVYADSRPRRASIATNLSEEGDGQFSWNLRRDTGCLQIQVKTQDGNEVHVHEEVPLPIGQWHQVAFVANGESLRLFRNGEEVGSVPCGTIGKVGHPPLSVGAIPGKTGSKPKQFWHGRIDELAIFDHPLNDGQIRNLFEQAESKPGPLGTL